LIDAKRAWVPACAGMLAPAGAQLRHAIRNGQQIGGDPRPVDISVLGQVFQQLGVSLLGLIDASAKVSSNVFVLFLMVVTVTGR